MKKLDVSDSLLVLAMVKSTLLLFLHLCDLLYVRSSGMTPTCVEEGKNATCQLYTNSPKPFSVNSTEGMTCTFWLEFDLSKDLSTYIIDLKIVDPHFKSMRIPNDIVHAYIEGQDHPEKQRPEYKNRTFLNHTALHEGVVSFTLMKVRPSDSGNYKIHTPELDISILFTLSVKQDLNVEKNKGYHITSSPSLVDLTTPYGGGAMTKWYIIAPVVGVFLIIAVAAAVAAFWGRISGACQQFATAICERFSGQKDQQNTPELSPMNGPQQTEGHQEPAAENDTMV